MDWQQQELRGLLESFPHLSRLLGEEWTTRYILTPAREFARCYANSELDYQYFLVKRDEKDQRFPPGRELRNLWAARLGFPEVAAVNGSEVYLSALDDNIKALMDYYGERPILTAFQNDLRTNEAYSETVAEISLHASLVRSGLETKMRVAESRIRGRNFDAQAKIGDVLVNMEFKLRWFSLPSVSEDLKLNVRLATRDGFGYNLVLRRLPNGAERNEAPFQLARAIEAIAELARQNAVPRQVSVEGQELFWADGLATAPFHHDIEDSRVLENGEWKTIRRVRSQQMVESIQIYLDDPEDRDVRFRAVSVGMVERGVAMPSSPESPAPVRPDVDIETPFSTPIKRTVEEYRSQLPSTGVNVFVFSTEGPAIPSAFEDAVYGDRGVYSYATHSVVAAENGLFSSPDMADLSALLWVEGIPSSRSATIYLNPHATTPLPDDVAQTLVNIFAPGRGCIFRANDHS